MWAETGDERRAIGLHCLMEHLCFAEVLDDFSKQMMGATSTDWGESARAVAEVSRTASLPSSDAAQSAFAAGCCDCMLHSLVACY